MNDLCCDCDADAGLTLQRQMDVAPIPYCLEHGYRREAELKQRLENYRLVTIVQQAPSELELAKARIAELEEKTQPNGDGAHVTIGDDHTVEQQLETALRTLEQQGKTLERTRTELGENKEAFNVARRELDRLRGELERTRTELEQTKAARAELERTKAELEQLRAAGPITPPPPTRPEPK